MITPDEIRQQAERKYGAFLSSSVSGLPFFPLEIRFRKPKGSDEYLALRRWVGQLLAGSKSEQGFGYRVVLEERDLRRYGRQSLPARITIETEADYLQLIGRGSEFEQWQAAAGRTLSRFPQLREWLVQHPQRLLPYLEVWDDVLAVCAYFVAHPRPGCYLRELPIAVHTKFIEAHQAIVRQLLDILLPPEAVCGGESHFERRFGLRYDEPQIRLRLLDETLRRRLGWPAADLALTLSACAGLEGLVGCTVFIVENKMTFLALPPFQNGLAVWGKGFQAGLLGQIGWLAGCPIWYWGDLDAQGFAILSQVRRSWPQTRSFLMDAATLEKYRKFVVVGTPPVEAEPVGLNDEEAAVYRQLVAGSRRLEQEHIHQADVLEAISRLEA